MPIFGMMKASSHKTAAVVVAYHPELNTLREELDAIKSFCPRIIIVDNTEDNSPLDKIFQDQDLSIISFGQNRGVAAALNAGFKLAISEGAEWIFSFDQDSLPPADMAEKYFAFIANSKGLDSEEQRTLRLDKHCSIGQLGPVYSGQNVPKEDMKVDHLITSGALTSSEAFLSVGGFREELFIDMVDVDFSYRLSKAGFEIWRICSVDMEHCLGEDRRGLMLGKKLRFVYIEHSPQRWYYMARNCRAICWNSYIGRRFRKNILKMLLLGDDRLLKLSYIIRGLKDCRRGVFGKLDH